MGQIYSNRRWRALSKLSNIRNLALAHSEWIVSSPRDWMKFLNSAARMYRYDFTDQLLIYAQRPNATACATLDVWNQKMNRWVNRGAKGIALIDDTVQPAKLRYVFDVRDTHAVFKGEEPYIWKMTGRHDRQIIDHLTQTYGLDETESLKDTLRQLAQLMTDEYLDDAMDGLEQEMTGSRLENLEPAARREAFRAVIVIEQSMFFLLENEKYGRNTPQIIVNAAGEIVMDKNTNDFDDAAIQQIMRFLHPEPPVPAAVHHKPELEHHRRFFENGTYERAASFENHEEQNYNMIDGTFNNQRSGERPSVRKRLQEKLALVQNRKYQQEERVKS